MRSGPWWSADGVWAAVAVVDPADDGTYRLNSNIIILDNTAVSASLQGYEARRGVFL